MGAEVGVRGGLVEGKVKRWPVSRGEERDRSRSSGCSVSLRLPSRGNAGGCLVTCVGVVGGEERLEAAWKNKGRERCRQSFKFCARQL
ncbi:hypothetical protein AOLI_G00259020 [Acnodon oligacanthus]